MVGQGTGKRGLGKVVERGTKGRQLEYRHQQRGMSQAYVLSGIDVSYTFLDPFILLGDMCPVM